MIAASEPLEFVPHGRTVIAKHPGQVYTKGQGNVSSENSLLYKLTNFAIKDESLLETKETDEQEWWCIREVYSRKHEDVDDDPMQSAKDKEDYMSESFRPPSCVKSEFNVSIKAELLEAVKKMEFESAGPSRVGSANSSSNLSKKFGLNCTQDNAPEKKVFNSKTDCSYEEELYIKGCTAVWSKGLISTPATKLSNAEHRETISCYTLENPIKHATFCNFYVTINNTMLIDALNTQIGDAKKNIKIEDTTEHLRTKIMPSILLIDNKCMRVFATDGREYVTSIPFQVKKVWPMKYGALLEKDATPLIHNSFLPTSFIKLNESNNSTFSKSKTNFPFNMSAKLRAESLGYDTDVPLPTCFSLSHPLDEVTPVLMKSPNGLQYYNDGDLQIIFVNTEPSIILLYDWKTCIHSLWKIRKALRDECLTMCPNLNSTIFTQSCDFVGSPMHSNTGKSQNLTNFGSPYHSKKVLSTPSGSRSRLSSPMANIFHQQGMSPHMSIGQASSASMSANNLPQTPPSLPLYPDVCLDHIWTDNQAIRRDPIEASNDTKAFLHTDLIGHNYLCFMVRVSGVSRLQIVRLQKSHSHRQSLMKSNLIVGSMSSVQAKDAVVLDHLKMMALIDEAGNIILQSGNSVVGKVHVGGVLARLIDSPYIKRSTFQSPFPRRSSLLPSRGNDSVFDDSALHLLSPVPHSSTSRLEQKETLGLRGICDAVGSRMTLQYDAGLMYRISLPPVACSSLVTRCCTALKAILPKDIIMQVLIKWYGVRNSPGTQDLTPEQEWSMFSNLLYALIGYDVEKMNQTKQNDDQNEHTEVVTKKQRTSSDGTLDDWEYLLNSRLHKTIGNSLANMLNLPPLPSPECRQSRMYRKNSAESEKPAQFNVNSFLFPYTVQLFYAFHLVYEEIKLNTLLVSDMKPLSAFLHQISKDLRLDSYVNHYWLDFPTDLSLDFEESDSQMCDDILKKMTQPGYFVNEPPNIFNYINSMLKNNDIGYYPYLADVNNMCRDIIEIAATVGFGRCAGVQTIASRESVAASSTPRTRSRDLTLQPSCYSQAVILAYEKGITPRDIDKMPAAIALMLTTVFSRCRASPPAGWPAGAYALVARDELAAAGATPPAGAATHCMEAIALEALEKETAFTQNNSPSEEPARNKNEDADVTTGMEHLNTKLLSLLYPRDHRMTEVFNLLQSSIPVTINLTQRPDVSDHDFIEEQEKHLLAISTRTMALPVARGMLTLRTVSCAPTEPLSLPKLCVSGRGPPPRCNTISLSAGDTSPHCLLWPSFHNGVAAGLALVPMTGSNIDASWVIYNKPRGATEMSAEHAGFLMALGLNGHLRDMPFMNMYEYLIKCHEMISVGLLLGIAATYRGSMDIQATKVMSIHLEPLLPPTSIELDIQQSIQAAALFGVGLLYQGTGHTHYARVLLDEIGKPSGSETENYVEREGYALAAGLALGLVCVCRGASAPPTLAHRLAAYVHGTDRHPGSLKEKYKHGSYAIREGVTVNLDVTSPGATLALGLIYMKTNSAAIAGWLAPPNTAYLLDYVRPDLLMLRIIARGLVLWDSIEPSVEWVDNQVPASIKPHCFVKPTEENIDYEAMNQAYCNIIAGACFSIGLRFAGSGDEDARDTALHYVRQLMTLAGKSVGELAGRSTLEACLCICLLAAGMVMSGRGDLSVLRICRRLRARVSAPGVAAAPAPLTHGGQMAVHCTIGLLFLGGGRATLSTSPTAIGALLAAFFPKFPTHSEDNRYHLQAFQHLYVLAVEPRLILPRDFDTGKLCYAHIQVIDLQGSVKEMKAPCIIPELDKLREVKISDPRYWPVTFQRDRNWDQLKTFLEYTWCVDIKQRAGCLSYLDDPQGFLTILAQTLTLDKTNIWSANPENIELFTNDDKIRNFVKHYLTNIVPKVGPNVGSNICGDCLLITKKKRAVKGEPLLPKQCQCRKYSKDEQEYVQSLSMITYECLVKDILCALPIWTTFLKIIKSMKTDPNSIHVWQIKLLLSQIENHNKQSISEMKIDGQEQNEPLISSEYTLAIKQKVSSVFDAWENKITPYLRQYLGLRSNRKISLIDDEIKKILSSYLLFHDLSKDMLKTVTGENELAVMLELQDANLTVDALSKIESLLR